MIKDKIMSPTGNLGFSEGKKLCKAKYKRYNAVRKLVEGRKL